MVVVQHPTESLSASDRSTLSFIESLRSDQPIAEPPVVVLPDDSALRTADRSARRGCILWLCQGQNENPGLESASRLLPSHTTVHAGPHTAVP